MAAKAFLPNPASQGVRGRHGTEDLDVTPGGLVVFSGGTGISDPISREAKWEAKRGESSDSRIVPQTWRKPGDRVSDGRVGRGRRLTKVVGTRQRASE